MKTITLLTLLYTLFQYSVSLKILVYSPRFAHSHANFMGKLADVLVEAGHDVTVLQPVYNIQVPSTGTKLAKVRLVDPSPELAEVFIEANRNTHSKRWTATKFNPLTMIRTIRKMQLATARMCAEIISNQELLDEIRAEKYDVAFAQPFDSCGYGLFHLTGVKYNTVFSTGVGSSLPRWIGAPTAPSYVPGITMDMTDQMTFVERAINAVSSLVEELIFSFFALSTQTVYQEAYPGFPNLKELVVNSMFVFANSDPLVDFPRPSIHKIIDIGGIAVPVEAKNLSEDWNKVLSKRDRNVLISFGSMSKSVEMPEEYKKNIVETCKRFPSVTFIWKYENESDIAVKRGAENIELINWVPQTDLLADDRLTAFITHGGAGSTNELMVRGKKAIVIPLFADQFRNARLLERMGSAIRYDKFELDDENKLYNAIHTLLEDESLSANATRLAEMLENRPFPVREVFVKYMEFSAKFGPFPQLEPYSRHLSFIQYFMIDVIFVALATVVLSISILVFVVRRCCCNKNKKLKTA